MYRPFFRRINVSPLLLISILFISCKPGKKSQKPVQVKIRPSIQVIVDSIAKYNQLNNSGVGFAGVKTVQWSRYEKLNKAASLPELRQLTQHKNSVVRCYSFDALAARKDTAIFNILLDHLHDTAQLSTFIGCIISKTDVGDYFINSVTPYDSSETGYKLSAKQRVFVDSILLFDKRIKLAAKHDLIYDLKPKPEYYNRVKEIAVNEKMPVAILALAKYKQLSDTGIINKAFNSASTEDYAIQSATEIPDKFFYSKLIDIFEREWKEKLYDYGKWEVLYQALAKYPSEPQTLVLFNRTIQTKDKFRYQTLGADLLIAITKYPSSAFASLKKQIKLDQYHMEDVNRALGLIK
ncbi:MAG TPA: hypothetical protein VL442_21395 [Mucilaginibacter sp.]|jgi:hypothetical protein|nr:hypothetical protein [Mucilaginibacter sp.]